MSDKKGRLRKLMPFILFLTSQLFLILWVFFSINTMGSFQNSARSDSLAMINVLTPWFWILILLYSAFSIFSSFIEPNRRWLHVFLLIQFALFLHFTPFLLSGFSWSPDSLWHGGIANYMPEILQGSKPTFSTYAQSYPLSFLMTYIVEQISGVEVFSYTLYIYPLICIITLTILAYLFASRLMNPQKAFFSILLALPALHFLEPHVSPFSAGSILVLSSLLLLTLEGRISKILNLIVIVALTLTHPISPISFGIFLVTTIVVGLLSRRTRFYKGFFFRTSDFLPPLFFLGIVWFTWTTYHSITIYRTLEYVITDIVTLSFLKRFIYVSEWTTGIQTQGFIYPEIHWLNLGIYAILLVLISILLLFDVLRRRFAVKIDIGTLRRAYKRLGLTFSAILYAAFGYLLFLASGQRFLLGRGLLFYIIIGSMCLSLSLVGGERKWKSLKNTFMVFLIFSLVLTFPIISYSKEAYNSFTPSSNNGLSFISTYIDLTGKSVSMGNDQQLAAYVNLSETVLVEDYPPNLNSTAANFIVLRINSYWVRAMRIDLSFENNQYVEMQATLEDGVDYDKIYSSQTFKVYSLG